MTRPLSIDDLFEVVVPSEPSISPDGRRIVYVVRTVDRELDCDERRLWLFDVDSAESRQLTAGPDDRSPVWSPDGNRVAWLSGQSEAAQIHVMDPEHPGAAQAVTDLPLGAGAPRWSPDGHSIAFLAPADLADQLGQQSTVDTVAPLVVHGLGYKADGHGFWGTVRVQPHVVPAVGGPCRRLGGVIWNFTGLEWHPDSGSLLAVAAGQPDSDVTGASSVYRIPASAALETASAELIAFETSYAVHAQWTRDADAMLIVGQTQRRPGHLHLYLVAPDGTVVRNLSAEADRNVSVGGPGAPAETPQELPDGSVVYSAVEGGTPMLYRCDRDGTPPVRFHGTPDRAATQLSVAPGQMVAVIADPQSFGELALLSFDAEERVVTSHGADFWAGRGLVTPEAREFTTSSDARVPAWVIRDPNSTTPGPLFLDIHGGPHGAWSPLADHAHLYHQQLAAQGWTVLLLNPPASDGYGEEHYLANLGAWGHGDQQAFLEPVEQLVAEGIADRHRLVVGGYSYGGFAVCWLTAHSDLFAAAIAGGIVSDPVSLAASDIAHPELYGELGASPWQNPDALTAQSPMVSVHRVRTPTLILHGTGEARCPTTQAEQWFTALRVQQVTTEMVLYPGASHLMILNGHPSHRRDYQARIRGWALRVTTDG